MIGIFLINLTQLEKTGSIGKVFSPQGNLEITNHFRNYKTFTFFLGINTLALESAIYLTFSR